jgi:hypothetical protein
MHARAENVKTPPHTFQNWFMADRVAVAGREHAAPDANQRVLRCGLHCCGFSTPKTNREEIITQELQSAKVVRGWQLNAHHIIIALPNFTTTNAWNEEVD